MLSQQDTLRLCSEYQIGPIVDIQIAPAGIENLIYFIETADGVDSCSYVLTVIQTPSYSGELYFPMMNLIQKKGLPVAAPIADRKENFFALLGNQKVTLQPYLPGKHLLRTSNQNINQLAELVTKLHKTPHESKGHLARHPRNSVWITQQSDRLHKMLDEPQKSMIKLALASVKRLSDSEDKLYLNVTLIRGDLFKDNVLFEKNKITGILDFHHASIGYCMYDLAVIAIDWCQEKIGTLNDDSLQEMLKSYNAVK